MGLRSIVAAAMEGVRARYRVASSPLPGKIVEIGSYHAQLPAGELPALSDRAWDDLHMDDVFGRLDRTVSVPGQQMLYHLLRTPVSDTAEIRRRNELIEAFRTDPDLRARTGKLLAKLTHRYLYDLPNLFLRPLPPRPKLFLLFPILSLVVLASIVLFVTGLIVPKAVSALTMIGAIILGIVLQQAYKPVIAPFLEPLGALRWLLSIAGRLAALDDVALAPLTTRLGESHRRLGWLAKLSAYVSREAVASGDPLEQLYGYLNMIFMVDMNAFTMLVKEVALRADDLRTVHETIGFIDTMRSTALARETLPVWCVPELEPPVKGMSIEGLYHPLVDGAVANDLTLGGQSLLITGSNASGKTTFIRAAGVAAVLAHTIATVPARRYRAPVLRVASLVARHDELLDGKSYFQVEVEAVRVLLAQASDGGQSLFIVDEIFRGTNTRERIAAAAAVLRHLNRDKNLALVSTHDLELLDLLDVSWEFKHFRETVTDGEMRFDYILHPGASSTPNALKMLQVSGYPAEVVEDALAVFQLLSGAAPVTG